MTRKRMLLVGGVVTLVALAIGAYVWLCQGGLLAVTVVSQMHEDKETGLQRLLCETDHEALLAACQALLHRVEAGKLEPGKYSFGANPDSETARFPKPIVDLGPNCVYVEASRIMIEMMGGFDHYGVTVYREDYDGTHFAGFKYGDKELIPGLWYYDDGYDENPRYGKQIDALLENSKQGK